jgi:putative redox protein
MAERTTTKLVWQSGMRFEAHSASGHALTVDSPGRPGHAGAGPMELLLIGVASCTAMDVVAILEKMREKLAGLDVEIAGERAAVNPKYYTAITLTYRLRGKGLDRSKVERAVELSHSTYCSALASLRPDCAVTTAIEISEG